MRNDPIVAEVREIRNELAAQCGYDLKGDLPKCPGNNRPIRAWNTCATRPDGWFQRKARKRRIQIEKPYTPTLNSPPPAGTTAEAKAQPPSRGKATLTRQG